MATPKDEGLKVIHASLMRMGTMSMSAAYRELGYKVHHAVDDFEDCPWEGIEEACAATFPDAPRVRPRPPFTRADWDRVWARDYDIATDLASPFTFELIAAYPEAKVVVVQRGFERWWPSFQAACIDLLWAPRLDWLREGLSVYLLGLISPRVMKKMHLGFFGVQRKEDITEDRARIAYDAFFERLAREVPPERRLELKLGDGWGPLCDFLGKDVPDVPFPRLNDRDAVLKATEKLRRKLISRFLIKFGALTAGTVTLGLALWFAPTRFSS